MSERIELPGGGYLEGENPGDRDPRFLRDIMEQEPIPGTRVGNKVKLSCGHVVHAFGNIGNGGGKLTCTDCRATLLPLLEELTRLGKWVRDMHYNRDDAPDEIARAIENRIRELERGPQ